MTAHETGYCYVGEIMQGTLVSMDDLLPGDMFRWVSDDDPAVPVFFDESTPQEQQDVLWRGILDRAPLMIYSDVSAPSAWGGAGCVAEELGAD